jgi:hypothetical protein
MLIHIEVQWSQIVIIIVGLETALPVTLQATLYVACVHCQENKMASR